MIEWLSDGIKAGLDIVDDFTSGEEISKNDVAKMLATGMTVAAIADAYGVGVGVIESLTSEGD